jgi:hypothetical protein
MVVAAAGNDPADTRDTWSRRESCTSLPGSGHCSTQRVSRVTGPKVDDWLVNTVGLLLVVVGCVLLSAVVR